MSKKDFKTAVELIHQLGESARTWPEALAQMKGEEKMLIPQTVEKNLLQLKKEWNRIEALETKALAKEGDSSSQFHYYQGIRHGLEYALKTLGVPEEGA